MKQYTGWVSMMMSLAGGEEQDGEKPPLRYTPVHVRSYSLISVTRCPEEHGGSIVEYEAGTMLRSFHAKEQHTTIMERWHKSMYSTANFPGGDYSTANFPGGDQDKSEDAVEESAET